MRTTLNTDFGRIIGEDMNGYCVRVSIENRKDLGTVLLTKSIEKLEDGELFVTGKSLADKELVQEFGTFIINGNTVVMKDREDLGTYTVEGEIDIRKNIYSIYQQAFEPAIKRELAKAAKEEAKKETKKSMELF